MKQKPQINPYPFNTQDYNLWENGYTHGLNYDTNIKCPVVTSKDVQTIWDQGFVAGRKDQNPIPVGDYCYSVVSVDVNNGNIKTDVCGFYGRHKTSGKSFCRLTRIVDDILLNDQCKVCRIKLDRVSIK